LKQKGIGHRRKQQRWRGLLEVGDELVAQDALTERKSTSKRARALGATSSADFIAVAFVVAAVGLAEERRATVKVGVG
jgi:hypothetical protein